MVMLYCDSGSPAEIERLACDEEIAGFTTNPSLIHKAGIKDYRSFAKTVLSMIGDKPVSFEVLADDYDTMYAQAMEIASWGPNIYVKVPITNTLGQMNGKLLVNLSKHGVKVNCTAIMTKQQREEAVLCLDGDHILSIFAGRIADTGKGWPKKEVWRAKRWSKKGHKVLWASAREVFNYYEADKVCDIITMSPALIDKMRECRVKSLKQYSLETVRMFYADGKGIEF